MKASVREQALTMGRRIDLYLTKNMPELVEKHDLATKKDLTDIDKRFEGYENDVDDLDSWKDESQNRIIDITKQMERLETKYDVQKEVKK
jgi:predicted  nucleic acid-binding Zn-ribbon protein